MKHLFAVTVLSLLPFAGASEVQAQLPSTRPPVSPYLNLLRPGTPPAINYFNLVRPQIDYRNAILGLQQQFTTQEQAVGNLETGLTAATTGHASRFLNTGTYFMRLGSQNTLGGGALTTPPARPNTPTRAATPPRR